MATVLADQTSPSQADSTLQVCLRFSALHLPRQRLNRRRRRKHPHASCWVTCPQTGNTLGRTEIVPQSSHPQWTQTIQIQYTHGIEYYFYAHVFHHHPASKGGADGSSVSLGLDPSSLAFSDDTQNSNDSHTGEDLDQRESIGAALFEVGNILGTLHQTKIKRLRGGGCLVCRVELSSSNHKYLQLQARMGSDLELSSRKQRFRLRKGSGAVDTVLEIAKRTDSSSADRLLSSPWITIWRSQPCTESIRPAWDCALLDLVPSSSSDVDTGNDSTPDATYHDMILRLLVRSADSSKKDASRRDTILAMAETTVGHLMEAARNGTPLFLQENEDSCSPVGKLHIERAEIVSSDESRSMSIRSLQRQSATGTKEHENSEDECSGNEITMVDLLNLVPVAAPYLTTNEQRQDSTQAFSNYVQQGLEVQFGVAIDFTSSNGDPRLPSSYHYQAALSPNSGGCLNDYEETILAIGGALAAYNRSQEYSVWGFGAKYDDTVRHIFQCGPQPVVQSVDGILEAYRSVFRSDLIMSGPTDFLQVLRAGAARAKRFRDEMDTFRGNSSGQPPPRKYMILLVITDGVMSNIEETRQKLKVYQSVPLSVIFVGVGRSSFDALEHVCATAPCNTTFVTFRKEQYAPEALGQAALAKIPEQICNFLTSHEY